MWKVTLRGLTSHKIRFLLTGLAVVLGVSFVVGSFVLSDGLRKVFNEIVDEVTAATDIQVRAAREFDEIEGFDPPIDEANLEVVRSVEGVAEAQPVLGALPGAIVPIDGEDEVVETFGPPILAFNWVDSDLNPTTVVEGRPPSEPDEFVLDVSTADNYEFEVGGTYDVVGASGRQPYELVGLTQFGGQNSLAGAVITQWPLDTLQELTNSQGRITTVDVTAEPGVELDTLITDLEEALPEDVEAVSGEVVADEQRSDFNEIVDIFGNVLLGFAVISLFVSAFIIYNTFQIVIGQRVRELALLRAIGASGRQVRWSVITESVVVGLLASLVGLLGGIAVSRGLVAAINAGGGGFPTLDIVMEPRTVILGIGLGVVVTGASALMPAIKASRIPPVAAMAEGYSVDQQGGRRSLVIGGILLALGLIGMANGLFSDLSGQATLVNLGGGAAGVFIGIAMLSPLFSRPVTRIMGRPLVHMPWLGMAGHLARENAARNNKRTSTTAAALMIGLALVATASVVAESLKTSLRETLENTVEADFFLQNDSFQSWSPELAISIEEAPEFESVTGLKFGTVLVEGDETEIQAAEAEELEELIDPDVTSGDMSDAADGQGILISEDEAEDLSVEVGDPVELTFADGSTESLPVAAIYADATILGGYVIDTATWTDHFSINDDFFVAAGLAEGVSIEEGRPVIEELADDYPQVNVETQEEFLESQESQLDGFLLVINVLLGFTIMIALIGIANTLALSVFERTREIGLLRAVGMTRRQTRSMVRWEAAIVAGFGAILGTAVGLVFGWAAVAALPDEFISTFDVPIPTLVIFVLVASAAGLVAAFFPARRAARMNVLEAISHL